MSLTLKKYNLKKFFEKDGFLVSIFLLASMYTLRFSMLDTYDVFRKIFMLMRLLSYSLVAIKFIIDFFQQKYRGYEIFIIVITMFMAFISYKSRTINYLTYLIYIIVGKDIEYIKIIKSAFFAIVVSVILVISLCLLGIIKDVVSEMETRNRHALGFKYAPFLSNYSFYATLYYIYIRKNKMKNIELLICFILSILIFYATKTRSAFALTVLSLIITFVVNNVKALSDYKSIYKYLLYAATIILPLFIIIISIFYNPEIKIMSMLNKLLNGRIALGNAAINEYGIYLFGQYIKFTSSSTAEARYNIVDSAFVLYLLILGIVFFVLLIIFLLYFVKLIDKKKDIYLAYIYIILMLHSTFDAQLLQMSYNYFMFVWSYKNGIEKNE